MLSSPVAVISDFHPGFHSDFRLMYRQSNVGKSSPAESRCFAADTVNASESLNDSDGIPVNVVVDQIVAVLQVLSFRDTVRCNQNINVRQIMFKSALSLKWARSRSV